MEHGRNSTEVWTFALVTHATTAGTRGTALLRPMLLRCRAPDFPHMRQLVHQLVCS